MINVYSKKYLTTYVFICFALLIAGQDKIPALDSLILYHYDQRYSETERSIVALKELAVQSKTSNYSWGEMKAAQLLGELYLIKGVKDSCTFYLRKSLELSTSQGDKKQTARSYGILAWQAQDLGNYPKAIKYLDTTGQLYGEINDSYNLAYTHADVGWTYMLADELDSAMVYSIKFLQYAEEEQDTTLMSSA